ncbi:sulfur carrier protein ThiS [Hyphomicrobium nitrativorans]|nr:sulfur carrier protein ThiS [Hyphomicrobium nitrativorans]
MADTHTSATERLREITVNGRATRTTAATLAGLVVEQGFAEGRVATAVNGDFVAERARAAARLRDGDNVEILSVRQGG